jgi:hypothetical protein
LYKYRQQYAAGFTRTFEIVSATGPVTFKYPENKRGDPKDGAWTAKRDYCDDDLPHFIGLAIGRFGAP